jgi:DNA replication and repair protein RecF
VARTGEMLAYDMTSDVPVEAGTGLSRLVLRDFRSYAHAELLLDARSVVLTGENGAGKTNLLEAVSLLSPGRGLRGAAYHEVSRADGPGGWAIAATLETSNGPVRLGTGIEPGPDLPLRSRIVRVDGQTASSPSVLAQHLRILWLTPAMDRLFLEASSERRRFLDRLVMGLDPAHGTRVNAYEKALRERNRLLAENNLDPAWLGGIEEQMAEYGVAIAAARLETLARLRGALDAAEDLLGTGRPFPRAALVLDGMLECELENAAAVDVEEGFRRHLSDMRARDAGAGRTLSGPHRTDLAVRHIAKDRDARLCSTGEQKALLIGIVLANARMLAARGLSPVLLLDEIAAHLDETRRAALFDEIVSLRLQAFMTGTDAGLFEALGTRALSMRVENGAFFELN